MWIYFEILSRQIHYFHLFVFFTPGDCEVTIKPEEENILGKEGQPLSITWNIQGTTGNETVISAIVYINDSKDQSLKLIENLNPKPTDLAKRLFGNRISGEIFDASYKVMFTELLYNDTVTLILVMGYLAEGFVTSPPVRITKVKGNLSS